MTPLLQTLLLFSVLVPSKMDFAPDQPLLVEVKSEQPLALVLSDLGGISLGTIEPDRVPLNRPLDLHALFPTLRTPGTYLLRAVAPGQDAAHFAGTPLVISVRTDARQPGSVAPMVYSVDPLVWALMRTSEGPMTLTFYYGDAPHTVRNFLTLAQRGFYDGLSFYRIVPGYLVQSGDPTNSGTGGPGYMIDAEFSGRGHRRGVVSMARSVDPNERSGAMPRAEFANSAGSQFFIVLDDDNARALDGRYSAFARVVDGLQTLDALGSARPSAGADKPGDRPIIEQLEVYTVTAQVNPYQELLAIQSAERSSAATLPVSVEDATTLPAAP